MSSNVSADLVWEIARSQNAYLVKRKTAGGAQLSRDPLNLKNIHSRKHAGFLNEKAVGVQADADGKVVLTTKTTKHASKPAKHHNASTFGSSTSNRKVFKSVANATAAKGYRADLRGDAVSRASALRAASKPKKETPPPKARGKKASA